MAASVATPPARSKPRAYFAQYGVHMEQSGVLIKLGAKILFLDTETDARIEITPANVHLLNRLDEVQHWVDQYYADRAATLAEKIAA